MFKFLKLRNSVSGDARRHVPFTSIIHKPLFVFIAIVFSFVTLVPVKVNALADPVPQFDVINGTDLNTFIGGFDAASADIQWITNALIGAQAIEYAGLGSYKIRFEQLPADADVWDRLVLIGEQITDELMAPYVAADRYFTKLIDFATGALNYAKTFASKIAFLNQVNNMQHFYVKYSKDFGNDLNQYIAQNGGLYNWQFKESNFVANYSWNQVVDPGAYTVSYVSAVNSVPDPKVRYNWSNSYRSVIVNISNYQYKKLFLNSSSGFWCLTDGTNFPVDYYDSSIYCQTVGYVTNSSGTAQYVVNQNENTLALYQSFNCVSGSVNLSNFSSIKQAIQYIYDHNNLCLSDFVEEVLVGSSLVNATEYENINDLGFSDTDSLQVLNPKEGKDLLYDLKALVNQIVQAQPDPNYELPLQPIIYNVTEVNGQPLTAEDLEGMSFNVYPPESGIDVPANVFLPFFDDGKGFISYMWYMTKPLVSYTRSFLDSITFDPVDGFNASGPGYFILGVAALGLIGGVIVKFLL